MLSWSLISKFLQKSDGTKPESEGKACGKLDLLEKATQGGGGMFNLEIISFISTADVNLHLVPVKTVLHIRARGKQAPRPTTLNI